MDQYSFEEIFSLDTTLYQLATYDVTKGLITVARTTEEFDDLKEEIAAHFNYLKSLIRRGSCTLEYLKKDILTRNGPYNQSSNNIQAIEKEISIVTSDYESKEESNQDIAYKMFKDKVLNQNPKSIVQKIDIPDKQSTKKKRGSKSNEK